MIKPTSTSNMASIKHPRKVTMRTRIKSLLMGMDIR